MKAVTIRVNDVNGIAGFVLPGDRVDVLLTRTETDPNNAKSRKFFNDVILQNVRVLGIDQLADDRTEQPIIAKAVTLEVSTVDAQRVALASNVGNLSLALRPAGFMAQSITQRISAAELAAEPHSLNTQAGPVKRSGKITVTRAVRRTEYTVSSEPSSFALGRKRDGRQSALERIISPVPVAFETENVSFR
jgi:pilus assembly protein CpaB